jgi:hypothetical protein
MLRFKTAAAVSEASNIGSQEEVQQAMPRVLIGNITTVLAAFSLEGLPLQQSLAVAEMSAIRPVYPRTATEQAAQGALLDFSKVQ